MALQIRRGTDAERLGITPLAGELVYCTDTDKVFVGDGSTPGGISVTNPPVTQVGIYPTNADRDLEFPSPEVGIIIYVSDGDGLGNPKFQGCVESLSGNIWVDLN